MELKLRKFFITSLGERFKSHLYGIEIVASALGAVFMLV